MTNRWSPRAALPDDDLTEAAGAVLGDKLYVVGGSGRHGVGNVYAYDPVTNSCVTRPALPTRRLRLAAGVVTDGASARILAVGGLTDANATSTANEAYKP